MKPFLLLTLLMMAAIANSWAQKADAGPDQTVVLPNNSVTVGGSSSGTTFSWTKIYDVQQPQAGYPVDPATIVSPNSSTTMITGLIQGVWYYQLAATSGGNTSYDTVVIRVNVYNPPSNAILYQTTDFAAMAPVINYRNGTTNHYGAGGTYNTIPMGTNTGYVLRDILQNDMIDSCRGKLYQSVRDGIGGYNGAGGFSELSGKTTSANYIDSNYTYIWEWKGYFPQKLSTLRASYYLNGTFIFEDHTTNSMGCPGCSPPFSLCYSHDSLAVEESLANGNGLNCTDPKVLAWMGHDYKVGIAPIDYFYNSAHTIRIIMREGLGYPGQTAFVKVELDGKQVYSRTTGQVGITLQYDYPLVGGIYDYDQNFCNTSNTTRGRVVSSVLESWNAYKLLGNYSPTPIANAGPNQSIVLPVSTDTLVGSGSESGGSITSYQWTQISGPSGPSITSPGSATTTLTGLVAGVYQFQLKVTDNNGVSATAVMQLTVRATNIPPVANAGTNQAITLPLDSVILSGSGTDSDGTVVGYLWTMVSGPSSYNIVNATSPVTSVTGLVQGVYQFQLQVTDNNGATGTNVVQVVVNPAPNIPPVANAGPNQKVILPKDSTILTGSGKDTDGTVVGFLWTQLSGPNTANLLSPDSAVTPITGLVQGLYQFQLQVTDNQGALGTSIVQILVDTAVNIPPVANAGPNQSILLPVDSTILTGSGIDSDGSVVSYMWTQLSGPSSANIVSANTPSSSVLGLVQGVYQFQLTVTDNGGAIGTSVVQVSVDTLVPVPPVANAGSDQVITLPTDSVSLNGSGSDSSGTIVSYQWSELSGPTSAVFGSSGNPSSLVTGLVQGVYQFQLVVTDNLGNSGTDIMQVTVNPKPNIPPVANAGPNQVITLPVNSVNLTGTGTDADGTVVSTLWTLLSGPAGATIGSPSNLVTNVSGLVQGVYQFQLMVTDNGGATATSVVQVTVNSATNIAPVANAGPNQTITLPLDSVSLAGSGTDADGTVVSYKWTELSGPSSGQIATGNSPATMVYSLVQGVYLFQLSVTDNSGATSTNITKVTVNPAPNQPPVANAGANLTLTLPLDSLVLKGSGSDPDGSVVNFLWSEISGPNTAAISNTANPVTLVKGLIKGVYSFKLKVTDPQGLSTSSVMQLTVNAAANIPPVANAGANQTITLPANSITLAGSGTDADGTIVSYLWTKVSGPGGITITSPGNPVTSVNGLTTGLYQFQLTVTDNNGAVGTGLVQVLVNPAPNIPPVANAGPNQSITLPVNTVTLSGSGTDPDGSVVSYTWTKISGPSAFTIASPSAAVTKINGLVQGVYQFQLKVTDNNGAIGVSNVQVNVNPMPTVPPVANAGSNQTITLPVSSVSLSGSGTDANGTVVGYNWSIISAPQSSSAAIVATDSAHTKVTGMIQGVYVFQLRVTDNRGLTGSATVQVTVKEAPTPPIANAGPDQMISFPQDSVLLSGTGTDKSGTISAYSWREISGPSTAVFSDSTKAATTASGLVPGNYVFELKVTDNLGLSGVATVMVIVSAPRLDLIQNNVSNSASLYPNPVRDIATLKINTAVSIPNILVTITNMNGQVVYKSQITSGQKYITQSLNLGGLLSGAYAITVYFSGVEMQTLKFLKL